MSKFHVNPATGQAGACRATKSCPFGDMTEDHYGTEAEARAAYEQTQDTFKPAPMLQAAATPTDSYLGPAAAREMWARGARVGFFDLPPFFNLAKPLSSSQGFLTGALYDHTARQWMPASFTPDGKFAFTDTNRSFSSRPELTVKRWDEDRQAWDNVYKPGGGDEHDVAAILAQNGYATNKTGKILAKDYRKLSKTLSAAGSQRADEGEARTSGTLGETPKPLS